MQHSHRYLMMSVLNVCFGGFVYGMATVIALKREYFDQQEPILLHYMYLIKRENQSGSMYLYLMPLYFVSLDICLAGFMLDIQ